MTQRQLAVTQQWLPSFALAYRIKAKNIFNIAYWDTDRQMVTQLPVGCFVTAYSMESAQKIIKRQYKL